MFWKTPWPYENQSFSSTPNWHLISKNLNYGSAVPPLHANSCAGVTCSWERRIKKKCKKKTTANIVMTVLTDLQPHSGSMHALSESSLSLIKAYSYQWFSMDPQLTFWLCCPMNLGQQKLSSVLVYWFWFCGHRSCLTARRFHVLLGPSILCMGGFSLGNLVSSHRPETCTLGWLETLNCPLVWVCD